MPQLIPPARLRQSVGAGDFRKVGEEFVHYFRDLCSLSPTERVLDIGCGVGRMAIPLAEYLEPTGSYVGIDISRNAIRWCQRRVTRDCPNLSFVLANVRNSVYNPRGRQEPHEYRFPFPDDEFDFAFLTSVFTHLKTEDTRHYLEELRRVLNGRGRLFSTWFLLNAESERLLAGKRTDRPFTYDFGDYWSTSKKHPETAIAHKENRLREMLSSCGFALREPVLYGNWCGRREFTSFQDIVIADCI